METTSALGEKGQIRGMNLKASADAFKNDRVDCTNDEIKPSANVNDQGSDSKISRAEPV